MEEEPKVISSVEEFVKIAIKNKNDKFYSYLYRGQSEDKPLLPKILRRKYLKGNNLLLAEKVIFGEFHRKSKAFLECDVSNNLELLAIAQHYGLETRLLDWTENALTALWFCVNKQSEKDKNGVVYSLSFFDSISDIVDENDYREPFKISKIKIFRPPHLHRRIVNQASIFTIHNINKDNNEKPNIENDLRGKLIKYSILSTKFENIKKDLNALGINSATITPDLGGLCTSINERMDDEEEFPKEIEKVRQFITPEIFDSLCNRNKD